MHNPIGTKITPHTPGFPGGGKIPTFLGCEGDFSPKSTFFVGALTAFRDFIHRFPRKCKFSSSLGANSTSQSMETTSELLWFCRGKCGILAGKGGKIPPGSIPGTHRGREGESHIPVLPCGQIPTFFKTFPPFSTRSSPNLLGFVLFFSSKFSLGKERSRSLGAEQSPRSPSVPSINGVLFAVAERRNKNQRMEGLQNPLKIPASTCPSHVHGPSLFQVFPCFWDILEPGSAPWGRVPGVGCGTGPPPPGFSGSQWCSPRCCRSCFPAGEADGIPAWTQGSW